MAGGTRAACGAEAQPQSRVTAGAGVLTRLFYTHSSQQAEGWVPAAAAGAAQEQRPRGHSTSAPRTRLRPSTRASRASRPRPPSGHSPAREPSWPLFWMSTLRPAAGEQPGCGPPGSRPATGSPWMWSSGVKPLSLPGPRAPPSAELVPGSGSGTCRSMLARSSSGPSTRTWVTARVRPGPEGCSGLLLGLGASALSAEKWGEASASDTSQPASSRGRSPKHPSLSGAC